MNLLRTSIKLLKDTIMTLLELAVALTDALITAKAESKAKDDAYSQKLADAIAAEKVTEQAEIDQKVADGVASVKADLEAQAAAKIDSDKATETLTLEQLNTKLSDAGITLDGGATTATVTDTVPGA